MGIIRENCAICSTQITKFLNMKLGDGSYICDGCMANASDMFKHYHLSTLSVEDFVEYSSKKESDNEKILSNFDKTKIFCDSRCDLLCVDEKRGLWYVAIDDNPDVFRFDQVRDCYSTSETARYVEDWHYPTHERRSVYRSIIVELEHPFIKYVKIAISDTESDTYLSDEAVGNEILEFFKEVKEN